MIKQFAYQLCHPLKIIILRTYVYVYLCILRAWTYKKNDNIST